MVKSTRSTYELVTALFVSLSILVVDFLHKCEESYILLTLTVLCSTTS